MYSSILPLPPEKELPFFDPVLNKILKEHESLGYKNYTFVGPPVVGVYVPATMAEYAAVDEYFDNADNAMVLDVVHVGAREVLVIIFVGFSSFDDFLLSKLAIY